MKNKIRFLVHIFLLACGLLSISTGANAVLIFEDDFESGNLDKWTIGGRQLAGANIANTVTRYDSIMGHLYKSSFTEITLENDFSYDSLLNFMLDIEVTSNGTIISSNYYAYSGVDFEFLDSTGTRMGIARYGTASTDYVASFSASDPTKSFIELTEGALISLDLGVADMLSGITIDETSIASVNMKLRTYTSYYGTATAELWVDNVCVDQGDVCGATSVPEPSPLVLIVLGLAGIGYRWYSSMKAE